VIGSYLVVRSGRFEGLEARIGTALRRPRGRRFDRVIGATTDLGSVYGAAGIAAGLVGSGRRRAGRDVLAVAALAWTGAQATKPLLGRGRPYELADAARLVAVPAGSSWPSGHAAVAGGVAATLWSSLPPAARLATGVGVAHVGLSRCYVGVHHVSDVVAGVGVGVAAAALWQTGLDARDRRG
jgi:membrane-associated phospholipid phosphatase